MKVYEPAEAARRLARCIAIIHPSDDVRLLVDPHRKPTEAQGRGLGAAYGHEWVAWVAGQTCGCADGVQWASGSRRGTGDNVLPESKESDKERTEEQGDDAEDDVSDVAGVALRRGRGD